MKKPAKLLSHTISVSVALQRFFITALVVSLSIVGTGVKTAVAADTQNPANQTNTIFSQLDLVITDTYSQSAHIPDSIQRVTVSSCDDSIVKSQIGKFITNGERFGVIESALSFMSHCDQASLVGMYGLPVQTVVLSAADDTTNFQRLLVFEPKSSTLKRANPTIASLLPATCQHHTIVATVAHEDDDLLFMNPAVANHIANGGCMVTIYLTAGDFGSEPMHWQNRRIGSQAAYAAMSHQSNVWNNRNLLVDGKSIQVSQISTQQNLLHIYLQLPDGGVEGTGFSRTHYESLSKLLSSASISVHTVDASDTYTRQAIISTLTTLFVSLTPTQIWTQDFVNTDRADHADHVATGELTRRAFYDLNHSSEYFVPSLKLFAGYQLKTLPANITTQEAELKKTTFHEYATHDITICDISGHVPCDSYGVYDLYLAKQYSRTFRSQ
jgi:LmbE family N-acetylglucosaminyl deacetylase